MKYWTYLFAFAIMSLLVSCENSPMGKCPTKAKFKMAVQDLKSEFDAGQTVSSEEKLELVKRFETIIEECYKKYQDELTLQEKQMFWKDAIVIYAKGSSSNISTNSISIDLEDFEISPFARQEMEKVIKDSGQEFVESIQEVIKTELPKVIDKVVDELEKMGDQLKKALEEQ